MTTSLNCVPRTTFIVRDQPSRFALWASRRYRVRSAMTGGAAFVWLAIGLFFSGKQGFVRSEQRRHDCTGRPTTGRSSASAAGLLKDERDPTVVRLATLLVFVGAGIVIPSTSCWHSAAERPGAGDVERVVIV